MPPAAIYAFAIIVGLAILAFAAVSFLESQAAAERANSPGALLGQGVGNLVSGVVGLVS
jgi:hypothetical protein